MNSIKTNKISRCKVPNLIKTAQSSTKSKTIWPIFFTKIQNSFRLPQQPQVHQTLDPRQTKMKSNKSKNPLLSFRLKQLSKHKQRCSSLPQYDHNTQISNLGSARSIFQGGIALPKVKNKYQTHKNHKSLHKPSFGNFSIQDNNYVQFQSIISSTLKNKGYQQIAAEQQLSQRRKMESIQMNSQSEDDQQKQELQKSHGKKYHKQSLKDQIQVHQNLTEWSSRIVGTQPRLYDAFDKKLMEKIRIYRPRKFKLNHQFLWK